MELSNLPRSPETAAGWLLVLQRWHGLHLETGGGEQLLLLCLTPQIVPTRKPSLQLFLTLTLQTKGQCSAQFVPRLYYLYSLF